MKTMVLFCFGWVLAVMAAATAAQGASSGYSESYAILIKGSPAGSETVTERPDDNGNTISSSEHEMIVTDGLETKQMKFSTRMILSKKTGAPVSYSYWYTSGNTGDSYEVSIQNGQVTRVLNRGGRTSEVTVPLSPDMVFVDFNVYHQYDYLVRKYDFKKGGRQTFADFIPVIGNDIPVALTFIGEDEIDLKPTPLQVRNFRIEFVGIWGGTLSVNKEGRLVHLVVPAQDLEVIRRDLLPQQAPGNPL
jgi:hypothetical protein